MQKPAASETEPQHTQQAACQVESEAVKDAANVEQAVKAQEDDERDLDDARVSEASQQADEQPTPRHTGSSQADTVKAQSAPEQSLTQQHAHAPMKQKLSTISYEADSHATRSRGGLHCEWSRAPSRSASSDGKVRCRNRTRTPERTLSRTTSPRPRARAQTSHFSSVRAQRQTRSWPKL